MQEVVPGAIGGKPTVNRLGLEGCLQIVPAAWWRWWKLSCPEYRALQHQWLWALEKPCRERGVWRTVPGLELPQIPSSPWVTRSLEQPNPSGQDYSENMVLRCSECGLCCLCSEWRCVLWSQCNWKDHELKILCWKMAMCAWLPEFNPWNTYKGRKRNRSHQVGWERQAGTEILLTSVPA